MIMILLTMFFLIGIPIHIYAEDSTAILQTQMDDMDFKEMEDLMIHLKQQSYQSFFQDFDFKTTVQQAAKGELSLSVPTLLKKLVSILLEEFYYQKNLMGKLMLLSIICALLKIFTTSFENKGVAEISFYVIYMVLILLLLQSFEVAVLIVEETVESLVLIMQAMIPTLMSFLFLSGQVSTSSALHPIIIVAVQTIGFIIKTIVIPIIFFMTVLSLINQVSEKQVLKQWIGLLKQGIHWGLKTISGVFIAVLGLHSLTLPLMDNFLHKTTQYAVSSVPVVGMALAGAVDTVLNCSALIKQAVGVGGILLLGIFCVAPILKIVVFILLYKLTAAIIQPLGEERVVHCIDSIGESCQLLLGCLCIVSFLFIISITMMIGMTNLGGIIR